MKTSEHVEQLLAALVAAAPEIQAVQKNKKAFGYKYPTLDALLEMLRGVLPKFGIWFVQTPTRDDGRFCLTTRVFHTSGEWLEDTTELTETELSGSAKNNDTQKLGASITYFRRYALSAVFGVASEEDTDGVPVSRTAAPAAPSSPPAAPAAPAQVAAPAEPAQTVAPTKAKAPAKKKTTPIEYILNDIKERTDATKPGESRTAYVQTYSEMLGEPFTSVKDLTSEQAKKLAMAIYKGTK